MFSLMQYLLNESKVCSNSNLISYSIFGGVLLYLAVYIYVLMYSPNNIEQFYQYALYVFCTDLLVYIGYYFYIQAEQQDSERYATIEKEKPDQQECDHSDQFTVNEPVYSEQDQQSESEEEMFTWDLDIQGNMEIQNSPEEADITSAGYLLPTIQEQ